MATKKNLSDVLGKLSSAKVKERQEGVAGIRIAFERDSAIDRFDQVGDGKAWLVVFQHLFTVVVNEKSNCLKKTTKNVGTGAAAERRLSEAASVVRWLIERCVQRLGRKPLQAILRHLMQTSVYNGELYSLVALDYLKAIRAIISYAPHLEHLDPDTWTQLVEMAWNVVLDDPVRKSFNDDELLADDELDELDDEMDEDEDEVEEALSSAKKRRRREASGTPQPPSRSTPFSPRSQPVSLEKIECAGLLSILLQLPSAPILSKEAEGMNPLATQILDRHLRFIRMYSADTSLHQDFILSLSATLSHLALNKRDAVTNFARQAWDGLLSLWKSRNKNIKEHLLVVLRTLFPFYTSRDPSNSLANQFDYTDGLATLWSILDGELDQRRGFEGLSLDCLRLQLSQSLSQPGPSTNGPFIARTFQRGWNFDNMQAFAWSILELKADCASKVWIRPQYLYIELNLSS
jgi:serine-protein kinase ATM